MATKPLAYNPPPNWPKPPAGWVPQPGWTPDASWGPMPAGWQLWVKPKGSRTGKAVILVGLVLLVVAGIAIAASNSPSKPAPTSLGSTADQPTAVATTTDAPAVTTPAKPKMTKAQEEALGSAQDYLSISGFSYKGLINQLVQGDGYKKADATFAADNVHANWKAEAARTAKSYLSISHFSRSGLIDQLIQGDGYTKAQATYGVTKAGL